MKVKINKNIRIRTAKNPKSSVPGWLWEILAVHLGIEYPKFSTVGHLKQIKKWQIIEHGINKILNHNDSELSMEELYM